jgi:hypothetical protein
MTDPFIEGSHERALGTPALGEIGWTGTAASAASIRVRQVVLRPCTVADAEAVERLPVSGWKAAYRGLVPDSFLDSMPADAGRRRQLMASRGRPGHGDRRRQPIIWLERPAEAGHGFAQVNLRQRLR